MKKIIPIVVIVVIAVGVLVGASLFLLPKDISLDQSGVPEVSLPTPRPAEATVRPTPSPTHEPIASSEPTPEPTPKPPELPSATPTPDLPLATKPEYDTSETDKAVLSVRYSSQSKLKVRISKGGKKYDHDLVGDNLPVRYPLNMGTGEYSAEVYERVGSGSSYRTVSKKTFSGQWQDPNTPYLQSVQRVRWDASMQPIYDALLLAIENGDAGKTQAIYEELASTLSYNWDVLNKLPTGYLPNIEKTYDTRLGICYDFSSLLAGMLRSSGVPTKLLIGFSDIIQGKHAWNEVLVGGEWVVVDLTVDSIKRDSGEAYAFSKESGLYHAEAEY